MQLGHSSFDASDDQINHLSIGPIFSDEFYRHMHSPSRVDRSSLAYEFKLNNDHRRDMNNFLHIYILLEAAYDIINLRIHD